MSMPAPSAPWSTRRQHVINLFVAQTGNTERRAAKIDTVQGFNIRHWSDRGLNYWAVSDLAKDELADFGEKFESAMRERDDRLGATAQPPSLTTHQATAYRACAMMPRRDRQAITCGHGSSRNTHTLNRPGEPPAGRASTSALG